MEGAAPVEARRAKSMSRWRKTLRCVVGAVASAGVAHAQTGGADGTGGDGASAVSTGGGSGGTGDPYGGTGAPYGGTGGTGENLTGCDNLADEQLSAAVLYSTATASYGDSESTRCFIRPSASEVCLFGLGADSDRVSESVADQGAGIEIRMSDPDAGGWDATELGISGVRFQITSLEGDAPLRFGIGLAARSNVRLANSPFAWGEDSENDILAEATYTVPFDEMRMPSWSSFADPDAVDFDPTDIRALLFQVVTGPGRTWPYEFCVSDITWLDERSFESRPTRACDEVGKQMVDLDPGSDDVPTKAYTFGDGVSTMCLDAAEPDRVCLYGTAADSDDGMGNAYAYWGAGFGIQMPEGHPEHLSAGWDAEDRGIAGVRFEISGVAPSAPVRFGITLVSIDGVPTEDFAFSHGDGPENDLLEDGIYTVFFDEMEWARWFEVPAGIEEASPAFDPQNLHSLQYTALSAPGVARPYDFCVSDMWWVDAEGEPVERLDWTMADPKEPSAEPEPPSAGLGGQGGEPATMGEGGQAGERGSEQDLVRLDDPNCGCRLVSGRGASPLGWLGLGLILVMLRRRARP